MGSGASSTSGAQKAKAGDEAAGSMEGGEDLPTGGTGAQRSATPCDSEKGGIPCDEGGGTAAKELSDDAKLEAPVELSGLLARLQLTQYSERFVEHGWDDLDHLRRLDEDGLRQCTRDVEMKPGHASKFIAHFRGVESAADASIQLDTVEALSHSKPSTPLFANGGAHGDRGGARSLVIINGVKWAPSEEPMDEEDFEVVALEEVMTGGLSNGEGSPSAGGDGPRLSPRARMEADAGRIEEEAEDFPQLEELPDAPAPGAGAGRGSCDSTVLFESAAQAGESASAPAPSKDGGKPLTKEDSVQDAVELFYGDSEQEMLISITSNASEPSTSPGKKARKKGRWGKSKEGEAEAEAGDSEDGEGDGGDSGGSKKSKKKSKRDRKREEAEREAARREATVRPLTADLDEVELVT